MWSRAKVHDEERPQFVELMSYPQQHTNKSMQNMEDKVIVKAFLSIN